LHIDSSAGRTAPHTSLASLKKADAGVLNIGYAEDGGWCR
jgi:hypothetical protein